MKQNTKGKKGIGNIGSTLNKTANKIIETMHFWGANMSFEKAYTSIVTPKFVATYNLGEFRKYPPKGPGSLKELLRAAVQRKLREAK